MNSGEPILFSWRVHPARERWGAALFTLVVITLATWLVAHLMQHPFWGFFAALVLLVACNRFFLPTSFELTATGITARYPLKTLRYQWAELQRFHYDHSGGFLSPRSKPSLLDDFQGVSLLFGHNNPPEEFVRQITQRLPKEAIIRHVKPKPKSSPKTNSPETSITEGRTHGDMKNCSQT